MYNASNVRHVIESADQGLTTSGTSRQERRLTSQRVLIRVENKVARSRQSLPRSIRRCARAVLRINVTPADSQDIWSRPRKGLPRSRGQLEDPIFSTMTLEGSNLPLDHRVTIARSIAVDFTLPFHMLLH